NGCARLPVTSVSRPFSVVTTSEHADGQSWGHTESITHYAIMTLVPAWLDRLVPFKTPEARRLALLFAVVYFAQGMYDLPTQTLTLHLKEHFKLAPSQVATFFLL